MNHTRKIEALNAGIPGTPIHAYITRERLERLAPFSLFDQFHGRVPHAQPGGWHPHSGIATFTFMLRGALTHRDTNGLTGTIPAGGVQWLSTGRGIWHDGDFLVEDSGGVARDLQLWVQLPRDLELGEDYTHAILEPDNIPRLGNTKILMGEYEGVRAGFQPPVDLLYLRVDLGRGDTWSFSPRADFRRGFVYPFEGEGLGVAGTVIPNEVMGIFEDSDERITIEAPAGPASFVIALAEPARGEIVARRGSIHSSRERMNAGLRRIAELGRTVIAS